VTTQDLDGIEALLVGYPEIRYSTVAIRGNNATVSVQLTKRHDRKLERSVFDIEKILLEKLSVFESSGYRVVSQVLKNGPPGSKAVGLKLIVDDPQKLSTLIRVSKEFETFLKTVPGTKNVGRSSADTPGQFVFHLDKERIATTGITAAQIYGQIAQMMNGMSLGSIEDGGEDMSIILKSDQFLREVKLEDVLAIPLVVGQSRYVVGDFVDSRIAPATASISRENGNIQITVDADLEEGIDTVTSQKAFATFADGYEFPTGISYKS
jgi:multidrug efflux pump subunit AcrB